jgi:hypothetical protein
VQEEEEEEEEEEEVSSVLASTCSRSLGCAGSDDYDWVRCGGYNWCGESSRPQARAAYE